LDSETVIEDPTTALKLFEALSSRAKIRILKVIVEKKRVTAKEVAEELGLKLPTVLEHLRDLVEAGVLTVEESTRGGRRTKVYRLRSEKLVIKLDLVKLVEIEKNLLENLLEMYLKLRAYGYRIKLNPSIYEIRKILGVDEETAKSFLSYLRTRIDYVVEKLIGELLEKNVNEISIAQIVDILGVDHSLAALVATKMIEKGIAVAERGRIKIVREM